MKLIIIGGGDNAGSVIDLIDNSNEDIHITGISDQQKHQGNVINGYSVNFTDSEVVEYLNDNSIIVSYARDMKIRKKLYDYFNKHDAKFATLISSYVYISNTSQIGQGSIIMPGVVIRNQANIGINTLVNSGATIEHGCKLGNHCHIGPGAVLTGNVIVEDECFIGANSTILPNVKITKGSTIGAGSVVTKSILENGVWYGNPVRKHTKSGM